jgi:hypothetical protein
MSHRVTLGSLLLFALVGSLTSEAVHAANRFFIPPATFLPQETGIQIPIRIENEEAIAGFSVAIDFDPAVLEFTSVTPAPALADASFKQGTIRPAGRIVWGVILDFNQERQIPVSADQLILTLGGDVVATGNTLTMLDFRDDRSIQPSELNIFSSTQGFPVAGVAAEDGTITVFKAPDIPDPPTCLISQGASGTSIRLAWTDNSAIETGFEIQRKGPTDPDFTVLTTVAADQTTFVDADLPPGSTFEYRVRATSGAGASVFSNTLSEGVKLFGLQKGSAKKTKTNWSLTLSKVDFDLGILQYDGDFSEIRVFVNDIELFGPASTPEFSEKTDKKTGNTQKITGKNALKDKMTLDFKKKSAKITIKSLPLDAITQDTNVLRVRIDIDNLQASFDAGITVQEPKFTKGLIEPAAGEVVPEASPCE